MNEKKEMFDKLYEYQTEKKAVQDDNSKTRMKPSIICQISQISVSSYMHASCIPTCPVHQNDAKLSFAYRGSRTKLIVVIAMYTTKWLCTICKDMKNLSLVDWEEKRKLVIEKDV